MIARGLLIATGSAFLAATLGAAPALAATSVTPASASIDGVSSHNGIEKVLLSFRGLSASTVPDLSSATVTVDGVTQPATATGVSKDGSVQRTVVLVLDCSESMAGSRFDAATAAARTFITQAPSDVKIGLVTFARTAQTIQAPTTDRDALRAAIDGLKLSRQTRLYDGVITGLHAAGTQGRRSLLVLTDGEDTTGTSLEGVTKAVRASGVSVDTVALNVTKTGADALSLVTKAGHGLMVSAADSGSLGRVFSEEAQVLSDQIVVSFPVPAAKAESNAEVAVQMSAGGTTYGDSAFVKLGERPVDPRSAAPIPVIASKATSVNRTYVLVGIGAIAVALLLGVVTLLGGFRRRETPTMTELVSGYGASRPAERRPVVHVQPSSMRESAVELTSKAIGRTRYAEKIALKLEAAGLALKPAEWVLVHVGGGLAGMVLGLLLTGGSVALALIFMLVGAVCPWVYLGARASRRIKAFQSQLPDALQLVAGGLQAGLSLGQAIDTIVHEGTNPIAGEFRRALVEVQLGAELEDALEGVAQRMGSKDFAWVVMAIRAQRQVGGNLGEILLTVTSTLREREYLRRHVRALSAEGRLSAWILGLLPPVFLTYLALTNREMVTVMFTTALGVALLVLAAVLMLVGTFWLSRVVKVEV